MGMMDFSALSALPGLWARLAASSLPAVLYGMGDGADKVLDQCRRHGVPVAAVFASDGFVRGHSFRGYPVQTLGQVEAAFGIPPGARGPFHRFHPLLCFATERPDVLEGIDALCRRHPLLVPDFPVYGDTLFTPDFLAERREQFFAVDALLADDLSRQVLRDVAAAKLTGEPHYLRRCETPRPAMHPLLGQGDGAVFVDAGAYTGDTVAQFIQMMDEAGKDYRRIIALEPDRRNFARLQTRAAALAGGESGRIRCFQLAAWSRREQVYFAHRSGRRAAVNDGGGDTVQADSIDNLLAGGPATLIKYDVEGAESAAILGSADTIRRWKPALSVAAYHRSEDLFALPLLLHDLRPDYRLYLRHHPYLPGWETNYYAI